MPELTSISCSDGKLTVGVVEHVMDWLLSIDFLISLVSLISLISLISPMSPMRDGRGGGEEIGKEIEGCAARPVEGQ